jgi:hypothetical protein
MKNVSWVFAFRKLNEWRERERPITFGHVGDVVSQGETMRIFSGDSGTHVLSADVQTGVVTLFGVGDVNLEGASFRFSDFNDSPFNEADLGPEEFESQLEATLPDGRVFVFAREWELAP